MFDKNRNNGIYSEVDIVKQTIDEANSASLLDILYSYNVGVDTHNRKTRCPFPFHKNGQETSASFYYYPDTNSFFCFGCKTGGNAVDFIASYEDINKYQAASLINNNYVVNRSVLSSDKSQNYNKIYLEFSHLIREFIVSHKGDEKAFKHAEDMCIAFDTLRSKYVLEPEGLEMVFKKLENRIKDFDECQY